jgi:hypothetical protein
MFRSEKSSVITPWHAKQSSRHLTHTPWGIFCSEKCSEETSRTKFLSVLVRNYRSRASFRIEKSSEDTLWAIFRSVLDLVSGVGGESLVSPEPTRPVRVREAVVGLLDVGAGSTLTPGASPGLPHSGTVTNTISFASPAG